MIKITTYYYGFQTGVYWGIEETYNTAVATAADYVNQSYIHTGSWTLNENLEHIFTATNTTRRGWTDSVKGPMSVTAHTEMFLADDMGSTLTDIWILKLPLDQFNTAHDATLWSLPESGGNFPGDSVYGSFSLLPVTMQFGQQLAAGNANNRIFTLTGGYVKSFTLSANRGARLNFSFDWVFKGWSRGTSFTGNTSQSANPPLDWSNFALTWKGEDDTNTDHSDCRDWEMTVENNLEPNDDLSGTTDRSPNNFLVQKRDLTGSMTWNKTTTTGQKWNEIVASATVAQTTSDATVQLGQFTATVTSVISSAKKFLYTIYNVTLGELPFDVDFERLTEITLPWVGQYLLFTFTTADTTAPARWDDQA